VVTKLLVVGVAGFDSPAFDQAIRAGDTPRLAALRASGVTARLRADVLGDGVAAWATLATGVQPEAHGVWIDQEPWVGGLRPTSRASWSFPPVWEALEHAGVSTGCVAWPATRPGAEGPGLTIDDEASLPSAKRVEDWALPPHCLPPRFREVVRSRRVHPAQITATMLRQFVPDLAAIDQSRNATLPVLAVAMAQAATVQAMACWMLEAAAPDAVFVHQPWLGRVRHMFGRLNEPRYAGVVPAAWRFLDALIGRLSELAPEATLLVVSPGWDGKPGVVFASGGGVDRVDADGAVDALDIAPTSLARFGFMDRRLTGRSWLAWPGGATLAPSEPCQPTSAEPPDEALLAQAAAWGFAPPPGAPAAWRAVSLATLARLVLSRNAALAADLARRALGCDDANLSALSLLATALVLTEDYADLPDLADRLDRAAPDGHAGALARAAHAISQGRVRDAAARLKTAETTSDPEMSLIVAVLWMACARFADAERVLHEVVDAPMAGVRARIGLATIAMQRREFMAAETLLDEARREDPTQAAIYVQWARLCVATARPAQADRMAALALRHGADPGAVEQAKVKAG
jgi:hypothetical protein